MSTRSVTVPLSGFGCAPTPAHLTVEGLTQRQRLTRAGTVLAAGMLAALIALPIPLVHFLFVPGALLVGAVLAVLRMRQHEIFRSAEASCPFCHTVQRLGLAGREFRLPRAVHCRNCGRALELGAEDGSAGASGRAEAPSP
ncbi:MAG TPA: hypothetical protein VMY76_04590 [Gemmatimonadales bacterium]|nr:hypothetical protein [Gemmatimonadales bacterium]